LTLEEELKESRRALAEEKQAREKLLDMMSDMKTMMTAIATSDTDTLRRISMSVPNGSVHPVINEPPQRQRSFSIFKSVFGGPENPMEPNWALLAELHKSVDNIKLHFAKGQDDMKPFGDDSKSKELVPLVRGALCTAMYKILYFGFRSSKMLGLSRYHIWDFFEDLKEEFEKKIDNKIKLTICRGVDIIKKIDIMSKMNDMKFRSLICYGLNFGLLDKWVESLGLEEEIVPTWYEDWSFLVHSQGKLKLASVLKPLEQLPFTLRLDYEITSWDL